MTPDQPKAPTQRVSDKELESLCASLTTRRDRGEVAVFNRLALDLRDARSRIAELEAERDRALAWCDNANQAAGEFSDREMAAEKRAARLAAELAEAKAAGREEGLREAVEIANGYIRVADACAAGAYHHDIARDAEKRKREGKRIADAIRARLSAAEPTADTGEKR